MHLLPPVAHGEVTTDDERKARMEDCFKKGKAMLQQCGIVEQTFSNIASMPNAKGCTLDFVSHAALQLARSKVAQTNLSFGTEAGGRKLKVWLDAGNTRDELRPALLTNRAYDILDDLEKEKRESQ